MDKDKAEPRRAMFPMADSDGWASIIRRLSVFTNSINSLQSAVSISSNFIHSR